MVTVSELEREYNELRPTAEQLCARLAVEIGELLDAGGTPVAVPIEHRVKEWESIEAKIERKSLELTHIRDLGDLVGVRVILLFQRDIAPVADLVSRTFEVVSQEDTATRLQDDQFGYKSLHYSIRLPETWLGVPSLRPFGNMTAELQVRTLTQHLWAAASHELQYKKESSVPPPIRRAIYRVSALLETVDLEFERVLGQREEYVAQLDPERAVGELDVDLLAGTLDAVWPADNKKTPEDYSDLLEDLQAFQISDASALRDLLGKHKSRALQNDQQEVEDFRDGAVPPAAKDRVARGVYYSHVGLTRVVLRNEFGNRWQAYRDKKLRERFA